MEKLSLILIGIGVFLHPIWLMLSHLLDDIHYGVWRDWLVGGLCVLSFGSFIIGGILNFVS